MIITIFKWQYINIYNCWKVSFKSNMVCDLFDCDHTQWLIIFMIPMQITYIQVARNSLK
jgi:hypothetical protein